MTPHLRTFPKMEQGRKRSHQDGFFYRIESSWLCLAHFLRFCQITHCIFRHKDVRVFTQIFCRSIAKQLLPALNALCAYVNLWNKVINPFSNIFYFNGFVLFPCKAIARCLRLVYTTALPGCADITSILRKHVIRVKNLGLVKLSL